MSGLIPKLINSYFEYLLGQLMTGFGLVGWQTKKGLSFRYFWEDLIQPNSRSVANAEERT
jgi:hypothetical protein